MKPRPMASVRPRAHADPLFISQFRDHVGSSFSCACALDGPAPDCDVGSALYRVAFFNRAPVPQRNLNMRA